MAYEFLTTRRDGAVEYLTLNRPDVRNAFNEQMIAELAEWASAVSEAARRHEVRAVVLAGAGPTFCAGGDAKWMSSTVGYTEAENLRDAQAMAAMFRALDELPVPLICRIQGAALGGGAGLAAVSDIVVAEHDAIFGFTEVKLGIVPAIISPFVLAKIGQSAARELFLTGARFPAARAREIGLVHAVVSARRARRARVRVRPRDPGGRARSRDGRQGAHPRDLGTTRRLTRQPRPRASLRSDASPLKARKG